jgi:hypothetical protein
LPLGAAFWQAGRFGQGGSGRGKGGAHCGTKSGVFEIKGLAARIYVAFILSALSAPPLPPPPRPLPRWHDSSGAGKGLGGRARERRDRLGKARP